MKRFWPCIVVLVAGIFWCTSGPAAGSANDFPTTPATHNGQKWRIGYLEGGPYANYPANLRALVDALSDLGWLQKPDMPPAEDPNDTQNLWAWLAQNVKSDFLRFAPDAYWSAGWDKERRKAVQSAVLERLNGQKDIDLMLAMGTWAGQDLANDRHHVATVVISTSDPLRSKIIKSIDDSGYDHLNARVDPTRYERQVRIFHDIFHFKKLGVVLEENTVDGRTYAAIDDVKRVADDLGFEVITCDAPFSNVSDEQAQQAVLACHRKLAPQIDALYLTVHRGATLEMIQQLLEPMYARKIPVFSQRGTDEVRRGALLSIARAGFKYVARFHAETIAKIFNGAKPRDLDQVFEDPPRIAINLKAAQIIGYDPPVDILGSADEVFKEIPPAP